MLGTSHSACSPGVPFGCGVLQIWEFPNGWLKRSAAPSPASRTDPPESQEEAADLDSWLGMSVAVALGLAPAVEGVGAREPAAAPPALVPGRAHRRWPLPVSAVLSGEILPMKVESSPQAPPGLISFFFALWSWVGEGVCLGTKPGDPGKGVPAERTKCPANQGGARLPVPPSRVSQPLCLLAAQGPSGPHASSPGLWPGTLGTIPRALLDYETKLTRLEGDTPNSLEHGPLHQAGSRSPGFTPRLCTQESSGGNQPCDVAPTWPLCCFICEGSAHQRLMLSAASPLEYPGGNECNMSWA
ncbi:E3 Ubiquitin-Protein Ligase Marchf3 [Manis pentadactyla]|nr:E3 Ubiquitin-Protein Ligase Marchf3 [Manis pentadactyla]